ncbi:MAG TPA: hypothetical protein PLY87_13630, partial [Planctomycetaceae bacterium]|nr:hypothetical protein [Planctomycetaceae bacterium]
MSKQFVKWIKSKVTNLIDPERESRVKTLAGNLSRGLKEEQKAFRINKFRGTHDPHPQELTDAIEIVYRRLLERCWSDKVLTEKENQQLLWVKDCLELSDSEAKSLRMEFAEEHFRTALAQAMDDGSLTSEEEERLAHIAQSVGESTKTFSRKFFKKEGEAFLRGIFNARIEDGVLLPEEWESLVSTSHRLAITTDELLYSAWPRMMPCREFGFES